jgi:hypothetical protein
VVLRDFNLQPAYRSGRDVLLDNFYVPCLQEAVLYDRAVGYFSSTLYHIVALALLRLRPTRRAHAADLLPRTDA